MADRRVPGLNEAERESLERIIRFAGWLPKDTKRFRELHDAVRALQAAAAVEPLALGRIVEVPQVGGLHHRYERRAA
jgi:hypothetical protein